MTVPRHRTGGEAVKGVREFFASDVEAVVGLVERVHDAPPNEAARQRRRENLFDLFVDNPYGHQNVRSLVFEEDAGQIVGFLGLVPKPFLFRGDLVSGAVGTYFMVDPAHRGSFAAVHLMRAALEQQDLFFSDAATDAVRRLVIAAGGGVSAPLSCHWLRPLRPLKLVLTRVKGRTPKRVLAKALTPPLSILDRLSSRLPYIQVSPQATDLSLREIDVETLFELKSKLAPRKMVMPDNETWLSWAVTRIRQNGRLILFGAYDRGEALVGCCALFTNQGQIAELLDFRATNKNAHQLFDLVIREAYRAGATGVGGRADPNLLGIVSRSHCFFRPNDECMVFHSRHPEIRNAFERGDIDLSRLDGEFIVGAGLR